MLQGKVWVWGQGGASAEQDSRSVKPALIPELQEQWPPRGHDGQPWVFFGAQYMRDLPYGMLDHTKLMSCCHEWTMDGLILAPICSTLSSCEVLSWLHMLTRGCKMLGLELLAVQKHGAEPAASDRHCHAMCRLEYSHGEYSGPLSHQFCACRCHRRQVSCLSNSAVQLVACSSYTTGGSTHNSPTHCAAEDLLLLIEIILSVRSGNQHSCQQCSHHRSSCQARARMSALHTCALHAGQNHIGCEWREAHFLMGCPCQMIQSRWRSLSMIAGECKLLMPASSHLASPDGKQDPSR